MRQGELTTLCSVQTKQTNHQIQWKQERHTAREEERQGKRDS